MTPGLRKSNAMARIPFWKMSGSGNDFIVIDNRRGTVAPEAAADLARRLCRRGFSVGADGLILIERSREADFAWRFFNADGSEAAMCGNGGRCAARFAFLKGIAPARMRFMTGAGLISAEVKGDRVKLQLPLPSGYRERVAVAVDGNAHRSRISRGRRAARGRAGRGARAGTGRPAGTAPCGTTRPSRRPERT